MKEHQKDIKKMSDSSKITKHVTEHRHSFNFDQAETLSYENNWKRRIIKESLYTQEALDQALNDIRFKLNVFG